MGSKSHGLGRDEQMGWAKYAEDNFNLYCERSYMRERRETASATMLERTLQKPQVQKETKTAAVSQLIWHKIYV